MKGSPKSGSSAARSMRNSSPGIAGPGTSVETSYSGIAARMLVSDFPCLCFRSIIRDMRTISLLAGCLGLASCVSQMSGAPASGAPAAVPQMSPECLAAKLRPADPMPVGAIPDEVLRKAQSGWVAVSYDVVAGKAQNTKVVASSPVGLYDPYVLRYASSYTEPTGATVRGCVITTNIKF